jgi:hypothetical protein
MSRNGARTAGSHRLSPLHSHDPAWPRNCSSKGVQRRFDVTFRRPFRIVSLIAIMAALLLLYRVHPFAGWSTLAVLGLGTFVARCRKASPVVAD